MLELPVVSLCYIVFHFLIFCLFKAAVGGRINWNIKASETPQSVLKLAGQCSEAFEDVLGCVLHVFLATLSLESQYITIIY